MEYLVGLGVIALVLALLRKAGGGLTPEDRKAYVEKLIDDLAGTEVVTNWKQTDAGIHAFTTTFKEVGYVAAESEGGGDWVKAIVDVFLKIINAGNRHFLYVSHDQLKAFGNVLAVGGPKPLKAGIVFRFVLPRGVDRAIVRDFTEQTRTAGLAFYVFSAVGRKQSAGLAAGTYFAYAKIDSTGGNRLLPAFVAWSLSMGTKATKFWRDQAAIVSPPILVTDKESLVARVDP